MIFKIFVENKLTGKKYFYSVTDRIKARNIYNLIQEGKNKDNNFYVWVEEFLE
jgi:hypothetical protein